MDNQAFCSDPKTWQIDEDAYEELQLKWKQSHRTFDNLLKHITEMSNTSTQSFKNMKDLRNQLKADIATICQDIANIQKVQDSLDAAQKAAQKTGNQRNSFANYSKAETITLKTIVPATYHSTVCTTHLPQDIICHQHCGLEFTQQSGNDYFSGCACMGGGKTCTKCECGPHRFE
jgi:predicted CopG family antitoxin